MINIVGILALLLATASPTHDTDFSDVAPTVIQCSYRQTMGNHQALCLVYNQHINFA